MSPMDFVFGFLISIAVLLMWATYKLGRRLASNEEKEKLKDWG